MEWILGYLLTGALAGFLAGLFGIGGGVVVVPALAILFQMQGFAEASVMHQAIATSLATIVFTSFSSLRAHQRRHAILWPVVIGLAPGLVAGAVLGVILAGVMSRHGLALCLGIAELLIAAQLLLRLIPEKGREMPGKLGLGLVGTFTATLSTLVGIGGGTMIVPFLVWCRTPLPKALGTSSACSFVIALVSTTIFAVSEVQGGANAQLVGHVHLPAFFGVVVASVAAAPLGVWAAHRLPVLLLRRAFALLLGAIGGGLIVSVF